MLTPRSRLPATAAPRFDAIGQRAGRGNSASTTRHATRRLATAHAAGRERMSVAGPSWPIFSPAWDMLRAFHPLLSADVRLPPTRQQT